ncbi:MAG TPA: ShlB/FhaC/HecB family hemolysin secretion/activation protein, partial [Verrucomicrobiae bacterium]|nr:ShlB/FhaC/HecB family hemolysin secretion/activation protein [Verrucomicrobiae bacterium]
TPDGSNPFITSRDSGRNLTVNQDVGTRLSIPWVWSDAERISFSGGLDGKHYRLDSFNTNNFTFVYQFHDPNLGDQTIVSESHSPQPVRHDTINYLPVSLATDFSETDKRGSTTANLSASCNGFGEQRVSYSDFPPGANPTNYPGSRSGMTYGKLNGSVIRDQKVFQDWSLLMRADGQTATRPLISNEQFALGGLNSVRGYFEGDEYGDAGWSGSIELRSPFVLTRVPGWAGDWPVWVRGAAFVDGGQRFLFQAPTGIPATRALLGTGFGLSVNINNHVDMRITVGWPIRDSANTHAGDPHAYFSLGGQF